jgi:phosphohistidine phosphatase
VNLLVVRHAIAEDRDEAARAGRTDEQRTLTRQGRERMRLGARGLARLVPKLDAIASSPLPRAWQTAEVLSCAFHDLAITELSALAPGGRPSAVADWVAGNAADGTVALVGHEPDLGGLVSWLLAGGGAFVPLRKGGACLLEASSAGSGMAKLHWCLTPKQLRLLGE